MPAATSMTKLSCEPQFGQTSWVLLTDHPLVPQRGRDWKGWVAITQRNRRPLAFSLSKVAVSAWQNQKRCPRAGHVSVGSRQRWGDAEDPAGLARLEALVQGDAIDQLQKLDEVRQILVGLGA